MTDTYLSRPLDIAVVFIVTIFFTKVEFLVIGYALKGVMRKIVLLNYTP